jgi:hypothetical protein
MIGYKFTNESDAQTARLACDNHFGYPKEDCVTQHWVDYQHSEIDGFWYIVFDESIESILGTTEEFEVTLPEQNS